MPKHVVARLFRSSQFLAASLLMFFAVALCLPATAQTAHFGGTLASGLSFPEGVAVDGNGNLYVTDSFHHLVKEYLAASGYATVHTLGGGFQNPYGIAVDSQGNVFVSDTRTNTVNKVPAGCTDFTCVVSLGSGFSVPQGVAVDSVGNIYVADLFHNAVKQITVASGYTAVNTLGGGFLQPSNVAVDGAGNVYVADSGNLAVKQIPPGCVSATCVNSIGGSFSSPVGLALDSAANVYVTDTSTNTVQEILAAGGYTSVVTLVNGLSLPQAVAVDSNGNLYVADSPNGVVRELQRSATAFPTTAIAATSAVTTFTFTFETAGSIGVPRVVMQGATGLDFNDAGTGTCTTNGTTQAYAVGDTCTVDVTFTPKVPGQRMGAVELINQSGAVIGMARIYGTGTGPLLAFPNNTTSKSLGGGFTYPNQIAVDGSGNVYVADLFGSNLSKIPAGCSSSGCVVSFGGGDFIRGVAVDGSGTVFIALENQILQLGCTGVTCVSQVGSGFANLTELAIDASGNVYAADSGGDAVKEVFAAGGYTVVKTLGGGFSSPQAVAVDSAGNVFVADSGNDLVKEIPVGCDNAGCVKVIGGNFSSPTRVMLDLLGNVYVVDFLALKQIPPGCNSASCVKTLQLSLSVPTAITVDSSGNLYEGFYTSSGITEVSQNTAPSLSFGSTNVGSTSGSQTVTLANIGNAALTFPVPSSGNNPSIAGNFTLNSSTSTCPLVGPTSSAGTLAAGATCDLPISFSPTTGGSINGSLVLTDNNLNASPSATQTIALSGTAPNVNPAQLTVRADSYSRVYGTPNPTFTGTISGAVNGDTFTETFSSAATASSPVGTYAIIPSVTGPNLANYTVTPSNGTLTVTQAATTGTLTANATSITAGQSITLTAIFISASSGTPTGNVAFFDGTTQLGVLPLTAGQATFVASGLSAGSHILIAIYEGDNNFMGAQAVLTNGGPISVAPLDFNLNFPSGGGTQTVVPGSTVTYTFTVTPLSGTFSAPVTFSLNGLPPIVTYSFSPSSFAANSTGGTVTLTVQIPPASAFAQVERYSGATFALLMLPLLGRRRLRRLGSRMGRNGVLLLLFSAVIMLGLSGCGTGNGLFTALKTYNVTVTASSAGVQHSTNLTLNVQ